MRGPTFCVRPVVMRFIGLSVIFGMNKSHNWVPIGHNSFCLYELGKDQDPRPSSLYTECELLRRFLPALGDVAQCCRRRVLGFHTHRRATDVVACSN